ncbi:MAG: HAD family hydrolase [Rubrimonas sp.]|uniref:HAD family hydrolase n=1 Tax=Rubrimonas sp. TaxID=2036015 RepID=UPI002FDD183F
MKRRPIRGVLFDKDGTLFDFAATWRAAVEALLDALAPGDAALRLRLGGAIGYDPHSGRFAAGSPCVAGSGRQVAEALAAHLPGADPRALEAQALAAEAGLGEATLTPAAEDLGGLLGGLRRRGLRLGVATHDSESAARRHLRAAGVHAHFDFVAGYDSGHGLKPGPGMVFAFAEATGLAPAEIAMVGDSLHDLGAARAAGAALAIGVLTGPADEEELGALADIVLPSIAAIPALLFSELFDEAPTA